MLIHRACCPVLLALTACTHVSTADNDLVRLGRPLHEQETRDVGEEAGMNMVVQVDAGENVGIFDEVSKALVSGCICLHCLYISLALALLLAVGQLACKSQRVVSR
jgi:hypothetical protein